MKAQLNTFPISGKTAVTLFLILLWYGYILAALNAKLAVGTTAESIAEHYADHSLTESESRTIEEQGFAEEEVVIEDHGHDEHAPASHEPVSHEPASKENGTISPQELVQLGHIHILGFSLLFISLGIILAFTGSGEGLKILILFLLFLFFAFDIGGLFLVRFVSSRYAVISFVSGIGIGVGIAVVSLLALYDMWLRRPAARL